MDSGYGAARIGEVYAPKDVAFPLLFAAFRGRCAARATASRSEQGICDLFARPLQPPLHGFGGSSVQESVPAKEIAKWCGWAWLVVLSG